MGPKQSKPEPPPPPPENEMLKNLEFVADLSETPLGESAKPVIEKGLSMLMKKKDAKDIIKNFSGKSLKSMVNFVKMLNGKTNSNEFGNSNGSNSFGGIDMGVLDNLEGFSNMLFGKSHMKRKVRRNKTKGKKSNVKKSKKH